MPVGCRSGRPESPCIIRQHWIAASENAGGRPGRPALPAILAMSLSSRISSDPRPPGHHCRISSSSCGSGQARDSSCQNACPAAAPA